jgi:hypothetical protein
VSGLQLGWVDASEGDQVGLILIAFVVPTQLLTSIFGFLARDGLVATGMGVLFGTWLAIGLVLLTSQPGSTSDALGLLLLVSWLAMWVPASIATMSKVVPALLLGTAGLRFLGDRELPAHVGRGLGGCGRRRLIDPRRPGYPRRLGLRARGRPGSHGAAPRRA